MKNKPKPIPKCKIGDLLIWKNDKGLISEIKTYPPEHTLYKGGTYYVIHWLTEQDDGFFITEREVSPVEGIEAQIEDKIYDYYPVIE